MTLSLDRLLHQATNILAEVGEADNKNVFDQTQNLIDMIRYSLSAPQKQLGVWETMELNSANSALGAGFFKLAITFACRAIEVNSLPEIEYLFGFEAVRHHHDQPEHPASGAEETEASFRLHDARDLLWSQNTAAIGLLQDQLLRAKKLTLQQKLAAESLVLVQKSAAETVMQEDGEEAKNLIVAQKVQSTESAVSADARVVEETDTQLFMRWAGDAVERQGQDQKIVTEETIQEDKTIALKLKESQRARALTLQRAQKKAAEVLVDNEAAGSLRLKSAQKKEAVILKETNVLKVLLQKKSQGKQGK